MTKLQRKTEFSLFLILLMIGAVACSHEFKSDDREEEMVFKDESSTHELKHFQEVPNDLVLIYDGGVHRSIHWNKEHFAPYVSAKVEGEENWLFDGFLFLEIHDGQGRGFASGYQSLAARKTEWENLLENYFAKGNGIHALNEQIKEIQKAGRVTGEFEKRKVVLCIPEPIPNQIDWGQLDGRPLQFFKKEDRIDACKWYIDYAEQLFENASFEYVELVGFYWLAEEATNSRNLARDVADYVYEKEYDFYWIPYFNSDGYSEWRNLGFNVPYYQPNYFFNESIPYSRLQEACDRGHKFQMNMEIEFDERALNDNGWGYRLMDYLDVYEKNGFFDSLKVAYYQGGDAFYKLSQSEKQDDFALYQRIVQLITRRAQKSHINQSIETRKN